MWALRCCFVGEERSTPAEGSLNVSPIAQHSCTVSASVSPVDASYVDRSCKVTTPHFPGIGNQGGFDGNCVAPDVNPTVAVDVATPAETPCLPTRWSDFGIRPELESFLPSPFHSANCNSFSRLLQLPDSLNADSVVSLGVQSVGISGPFSAVTSRKPLPSDLQCCTISQLIGSISSACWVGQGAHGAVVKAQWRSGCTVAVKWLVTDAVNVPAAFMEALLAKMLAHPSLVQSFDCAMCQLDETFNQMVEHRSCVRTLSLLTPPKVAICLPTSDGTAVNGKPKVQVYPEENLAVATSLDSFEGNQTGQPFGPRPVDCWEILKQLGATPGKYVVQIVSEWCDEGTLHSAIRRGVFRTQSQGPGVPGRSRTWALRALLRTGREIAQGMCHLHSLNIIHGDLKPGNVLLKSSRIDSRGFVAKVADFGLSRLCNQREEFVATAEWGTVPYMAGEYLDNRLCKSSDVYSFGVLLWQMYTGKTPFAGHLEAQVAVGVMLGNLTLEWPPKTPLALLRLGQACCRHEPEQRPTFKEVVAELVRIEGHVRELAVGLKARHAILASPTQATAHGQQRQEQQQHHHHHHPDQQELQSKSLSYGGDSALGAAPQQPSPILQPLSGLSLDSASPFLPGLHPHNVQLAGASSLGGAPSTGVRAGGGVEMRNASVLSMTAAPLSYFAGLPSARLDQPGGDAQLAATETSCLLSGCGLTIGGSTAVGGAGYGSSPSYPVSDSLPMTHLLVSYPSQRQMQEQQQQEESPQQQQHHTLSERGAQGGEANVALHALRVAALAVLPDGPLSTRMLTSKMPSKCAEAVAERSRPLGSLAARCNSLESPRLGQRSLMRVRSSSSACSQFQAQDKVTAAVVAVEMEVAAAAAALWHAETVDSNGLATPPAASATTPNPVDRSDVAASGGGSGGGGEAAGTAAITTSSTMASSCLALATTPTMSFLSGGSASLTPISTSVLGTGNFNGYSVAAGALKGPMEEGSAAAARAAYASSGPGGSSSSGSTSSWALGSLACCSSAHPPRLLSSTAVVRGGEGQLVSNSPPRMLDAYGQYLPGYPYGHSHIGPLTYVASNHCRRSGGGGVCSSAVTRSCSGGGGGGGGGNCSFNVVGGAAARVCTQQLTAGCGWPAGSEPPQTRPPSAFAAVPSISLTAAVSAATELAATPQRDKAVALSAGASNASESTGLCQRAGSGVGVFSLGGGGGGGSGSGFWSPYIPSPSGPLAPLIAPTAPLQLRAMSSRRASAGPALQHVPEDDDLDAASAVVATEARERQGLCGVASTGS